MTPLLFYIHGVILKIKFFAALKCLLFYILYFCSSSSLLPRLFIQFIHSSIQACFMTFYIYIFIFRLHKEKGYAFMNFFYWIVLILTWLKDLWSVQGQTNKIREKPSFYLCISWFFYLWNGKKTNLLLFVFIKLVIWLRKYADFLSSFFYIQETNHKKIYRNITKKDTPSQSDYNLKFSNKVILYILANGWT